MGSKMRRRKGLPKRLGYKPPPVPTPPPKAPPLPPEDVVSSPVMSGTGENPEFDAAVAMVAIANLLGRVRRRL